MLKTFKYILLSLVLHALLVVPLLFYWVTQTPSPILDAVELEIVSTPKSGGTPAGSLKPSGKASKGGGTTNTAQALAQKLLGEPYYKNPGTDSATTNNTSRPSGSWEEGTYGTKDDPNVAWGAGSGTFERIHDLALMDRFHQKVDALLFYPGVLARHKISGTINTRIVLNQAGDCDWHMTKIQAGEPHLRIFVLHLLKKLCDENFKKYLSSRERTNIDMSFMFSISEQPDTEELIRQNQKVVGNVLLFFRNSHKSIAEWHLGPFKGMFPIPLVNLDFEWIFENFDKYINHNDPMKEFR